MCPWKCSKRQAIKTYNISRYKTVKKLISIISHLFIGIACMISYVNQHKSLLLPKFSYTFFIIFPLNQTFVAYICNLYYIVYLLMVFHLIFSNIGSRRHRLNLGGRSFNTYFIEIMPRRLLPSVSLGLYYLNAFYDLLQRE